MKNLNYKHLFYFWQVARLGQLTQAAHQLHVAQSALSSQIRQLERYLGHPLFDRVGRNIVLTEFGQTVFERAEQIFGLGQELLAMARAGEGLKVQQLRIGAVATLSRNFQENLLKPLLARSDVRLSLESGGLEELLVRLKGHHLDLVLSNTPVVASAGRPWRCARIDQQDVCLVGPPRSKRRPMNLPSDLQGARVVVPGPSSDIRSQFDVWCERQKISVDVAIEVDDMAMLRLLARDSGLVTIVPEVVVQDELRDGRLERYGSIQDIRENFYAITAIRQRGSALLDSMLTARSHQGG